MKKFTANRNFWVIVATLSFVFLVYFLYLWVYTEVQETKIIDTRFRSLSNIGNNITKKKKALDGSIVNSLVEDLKIQIKKVRENRHKKIDTTKGKAYIDSIDYELFKSQKVIDSILVKLNTKYPSLASNTKVKIYNRSDDKSRKAIDSASKDMRYLYFNKPWADSLTINLSVPIEYLTVHTLAGSLFSGFLLIRGSSVAFNSSFPDLMLSEVNLENNENFKSLLEKNPELFNKFKDDYSNLVNIPENDQPGFKSLHSGKIYNVTIANTEYKLFLKPITLDNNEIWHLGGMMARGDYNRARRSVPPELIIILSFILLLMILSMPVIKIFVIGKFEQLNAISIISAVVTIIIGVPILTGYLIFFYQNMASDQRIQNELYDLSTEIDSVFCDEIDNIYHQLDEYEKNFNFIYHPNKIKSILSTINPGISYPGLWKSKNQKISVLKNDSLLSYPKIYPFFDIVIWMNGEGRGKFNLTTSDIPAKLISVGHRDYFKLKDSWYLPVEHAEHKNLKFRIQSIYSNTTGESKAAVSKPSTVESRFNNTELEALVATGRMYSVIDAKLPKGYGFCIMEASGKVWFHHDKHRNLKENFVEECDNDDLLKAAIYSQTPRQLDLQYYNKKHSAYIHPISNVPLYLVTYYDFQNEKSFQLQTFSLTFLFYSILLVVLFFQILTFFIMKADLYRSFKKHVLIEIIRPKKPDTLRYIKNIHLNLLIIFLLVIFLHFIGGAHKVFMVFFTISLAFTFSYLFLNHHQNKQINKKALAWIATVLLFVANLVLGVFTYNSNLGFSNLILVLLFQIILLIIVFVFYRWIVVNREYNYHILRLCKKNYLKYYTSYIITNLVLIGVIPVLAFYQVSFTEEVKFRVKHQQYDLAKKIEQHKKHQLAYYKSIKLSDSTIVKNRIKNGIYTEHIFNTKYADYVDSASVPKADTTNLLWNNLIGSFRPIYDDYSKESKFFSFNSTHDDTYLWSYQDKNRDLSLFYKANMVGLKDSTAKLLKRNYHSISSTLPTFSFYGLAKTSQSTIVEQFVFNIMFWLILVLILMAIRFLISRGASRVFAIQIIDSYAPFHFTKHLSHLLKTRKYIGLHSNSPLDIEELKSFVEAETSSVRLLSEHCKNHDLLMEEFSYNLDSSNAEKSKSRRKTLLVHPFDTFFLDRDNNKSLLELLIKVNETNSQIILVMHRSPSELIDILKDIEQDKSAENEEGNDQIKNQYYQWRFFFDHFSMTNIPLEYADSKNEHVLKMSDIKIPPTSKQEYKQLAHFVYNECAAANYLKQFAHPLWNYIYPLVHEIDLATAKDWATKKLMELSTAYYKDIFRALSPEEKFVLYDLATDSVMNPNAYPIIVKLMKQGYLTKEIDKIQIMNHSFQMFVQSQFTKKDVKELAKSQAGGAWAGFKIPLLVIIAALIVMIGLGNQQILKDLNKFLLVFGAGITSLTSIVGVISRTKKSGGRNTSPN